MATLDDRVTKLEAQVSKLQQQVQQAIYALQQQGKWITDVDERLRWQNCMDYVKGELDG